MTRAEAQAIISALVKLRGIATDEQALEVPALYPTWKADAQYAIGERVLHGGIFYKVLQNHTSQEAWTPDVSASLFAKVLIPDSEIPAWEQPDSTNGYMKGDTVTHNGKTWTSDTDNNVWEPGVYGWTEVV